MTARILLLDIETAPITAHVWGLRDQNVALNQIRDDGRVIGFGAKWYGAKGAVRFYSEYHNTRAEMIERAHELLDAADLVVHFNGQSFDVPWLNTEFARHGLTPPAPFKNVDLYRVVRRNFRFPSYKLAYVSKFLVGGAKVAHTGHQLWVDCLEGDEEARRKAWNLMARYCKQDVALLAPLYDVLRPWIGSTHPNLALYSEDVGPSCPTCESQNLQRRGYAVAKTRRYQRYQCQECGTWTQDTKSDPDKKVEQNGATR